MATGASLVVLLGLDSAKFHKNLGKAGKSASNFSKNVGKKFKSAGAGLTGIFSAAGAKVLLENADNLIKAADAAGFGFENYQRLQFGYEQAGVSAKAFNAAILRNNKSIREASEGSKKFQKIFSDLNIEYKDFEKFSPEERFIKVASALKKIEDPAKRQVLQFELMGKQFGVIKADIDEVVKAGEGLDNIVSEEAARSSEVLRDSINKLIVELKNFITNILPGLITQLEKITVSFGILLESLGLVKKEISPTVAATAALVSEFEKLDTVGTLFNSTNRSIFWGLRQSVTAMKDGSSTISQFITETDVALQKLPESARAAGTGFRDNLLQKFRETYDEAVGHSIIPDMLASIESLMNKTAESGKKGGIGFADFFLDGISKAKEGAEKKNVANTVRDQLSEAAQYNKEAFIANKAVSIADAIINTYVGATEALALGPFIGPALAAAQVALGFIQVNAIRSQTYKGMATGGLVTSSGGFVVGEEGPELLNLPAGSSVTPNDQIGQTVTYNINAVDAASFHALIRRNPEVIEQAVRSAQRRKGVA